MPPISRRGYLRGVGAAGAVGFAGAGGTVAAQEDVRIGISQHLVGGAWVTAFHEAGEWYADAKDLSVNIRIHDEDTAEQIEHIRQFVAEDFDGIVAAPFDEAVDSAIEDADEAGIPVFTANDPGTTDAIKSYTGFDNYLAGQQCAELMLEAFSAEYEDRTPYEIVHVRGPFTQASNARTDGFLEYIEETEDASVVTQLESDWSEADAQSTLLDWLSANDQPDGIYSSNMTSGLGTHAALERLDLASPYGEDDHVVLTQPDGGPQVHPLIADRHIYAAVDQPNYYYIPLAIEQLLAYFEGGDEALPEPGTEVDETDLEVESAHIEEIDQELWTDPIWAPAAVEERNGHPHVLTDNTVITEENVDDPALWGNIWSDE